MFQFLIENIGTFVVSLIIAGITMAIVLKIIRDKGNGKYVGCNCGHRTCIGQSNKDCR